MSSQIDRDEFVESRPLPPFGGMIKLIIGVMELTDPNTYRIYPPDVKRQRRLDGALETISKRRVDDIFRGELVKVETKRSICEALAICLCAIPELPFSDNDIEQIAHLIEALWIDYETASGHLSAIAEGLEAIPAALRAQATVDFAIRAAAMAVHCGDSDAREDIPLWSRHEELKKRLRDVVRFIGTREKVASAIGCSESELDRWLDDLDVPSVGQIRRLDELLEKNRSGTRKNFFWRLYVGRRLFQQLRIHIPKDTKDDLLRAYCRIRRRLHAHFRLSKASDDLEKQKHIKSLLGTARIVEPYLGFSLLSGEQDLLWRRHLEAVTPACCRLDILNLFETYAQGAAVIAKGPPNAIPRIEEFMRFRFKLADEDTGISGSLIRNADEARSFESKGQLDKAEEIRKSLMQYVGDRPEVLQTAGRIRACQQDLEGALQFYYNARERNPHDVDILADIGVLLANAGRAKDALAELEKASDDQRQQLRWIFARGRALVAAREMSAGKTLLIQCAKQGFQLRFCYQLLVEACEALGEAKEAREYRKRFHELNGCSGSTATGNG